MLTGNVMVDRRSLEGPRNVVVEDKRDFAGLREWAERAQSEGAGLWMQINHPGRQAIRSVSSEIVAPSPVSLKGFGPLFKTPRSLERGEILSIITRFATTAAIAKEAGFAGVQIHGAHGYLVSQFLSPLVNRRSDEWGGTSEKRMRFLIEIVRSIRARVGISFPIAVKLNSADFQLGGFDEKESLQVVKQLEREGIDLLEISGGNYESPAMVSTSQVSSGLRKSTVRREAYFLAFAKKARNVSRTPLLLTGGLRTAATMTSIVNERVVDFVGIGRPLAINPDFARELLESRTEGSPPIHLSFGVKRLDDMLQNFWYQDQIRLLATGRDPNPRLNRYGSLTRGLFRLVFQ